jgi:hypothetical protein
MGGNESQSTFRPPRFQCLPRPRQCDRAQVHRKLQIVPSGTIPHIDTLVADSELPTPRRNAHEQNDDKCNKVCSFEHEIRSVRQPRLPISLEKAARIPSALMSTAVVSSDQSR